MKVVVWYCHACVQWQNVGITKF